MKFVVDNGEKGLPSLVPAMVQRIRQVLDKVPDGRLLTTRALANRLQCAHSSVLNHTAHPELLSYKLKLHRTVSYFGNPKTIAAARKEFNEEN